MMQLQNELDYTRANAIEHYKRKIARIDMIGQRAIKELEDNRRKEELKVKEKANKIRKTGKVPVTCFCFKSLQDQEQESSNDDIHNKYYLSNCFIQY